MEVENLDVLVLFALIFRIQIIERQEFEFTNSNIKHNSQI